MAGAAICVRSLARSFGAAPVLRDVSLEVPAGSTAVIVGANGSGKTTLLEILATLLTPTSGEVRVHGHDAVRDGAAVRRLIGYGFSTLHSFYPQLSARQNLEFFAAVHGLAARAARRRADCLLDALGLGAASAVRVQHFSDGMKARLSVARALVADPPVLLLDEPTKSLDAASRAAVWTLAASPTETRGPRTVVWTTHDRDEAFAIADAVSVLEDGVLRRVASAGGQSARIGRAVPA
jgi:ABC-2 type transport system ATP-binding protein